MTSLREEIYKEIEEWDVTRYKLEICVNDIISKIEKRIDILKQEYRELKYDEIKYCKLCASDYIFREMKEILK